jgi:two-component system response regulator AtoC
MMEVLPGAETGGPPAAVPALADVAHVRQQAEVRVIMDALQTTKWNRKEAAKLLKVDYKALLYKMKKLNLNGDRKTAPQVS